MIQAELLLNARPVQGALGADNGIATVFVAAVGSVRHFILGIEADYTNSTPTIKTVTVKRGTTTLHVYRWDFTKGPFVRNLPAPWHGEPNEAVSVDLEAGGVGIFGRVGITVASL